jgi:hypothetical protein
MSFQRARISCYNCLDQEVGTRISLFLIIIIKKNRERQNKYGIKMERDEMKKKRK